MRLSKGSLVAVTLMALLSGAATCTAQGAKEQVLRKLDESAKKFHSLTSDFSVKVVESQPWGDDTILQDGVAYYERTGNSFRMAGHIDKIQGKPQIKIYTYANGVFKLYDKTTDEINSVKTGSNVESYAVLGFGASGHELEDKWTITDKGSEMLQDGKAQVKTEHFVLIAKDPEIKKNLQKVEIWVDPERAISLKQIFYQSPTLRRECHYSNFRLNTPQPASAYVLPTPKKK